MTFSWSRWSLTMADVKMSCFLHGDYDGQSCPSCAEVTRDGGGDELLEHVMDPYKSLREGDGPPHPAARQRRVTYELTDEAK